MKSEVRCDSPPPACTGMLRLSRLLLVLVTAFALGGCSPVMTKARGKTWVEPFSGPRNDLTSIELGSQATQATQAAAAFSAEPVVRHDLFPQLMLGAAVMLAGPAMALAAAADMPRSMVADTLLLHWRPATGSNPATSSPPGRSAQSGCSAGSEHPQAANGWGLDRR